MAQAGRRMARLPSVWSPRSGPARWRSCRRRERRPGGARWRCEAPVGKASPRGKVVGGGLTKKGGGGPRRGDNGGFGRRRSSVGGGSGRRRWRRRGPTSSGKGGASEAHGKTTEGRPRVTLTGEAESAVVLLRDLGTAAALRSAGADERHGGGGGCSRRAPCEEKGGAGENFGPAAADAF
jgi:hypothetical protein